MHLIPARLRLSSRRVLPPGLCAALLLLAGMIAPRAQIPPMPELRFEILWGDTVPVGSEPNVFARIINPRGLVLWPFGEPAVLTLSSPLLPLPVEGTLWWGWMSDYVSANLSTAAGPGVYELVARASTADLVTRLVGDTNAIA